MQKKSRLRTESPHDASLQWTAAGSPHPVDVLRTLDGDLRQSGDVQLSAAVRVHLDVQPVAEILAQQVATGGHESLISTSAILPPGGSEGQEAVNHSFRRIYTLLHSAISWQSRGTTDQVNGSCTTYWKELLAYR